MEISNEDTKIVALMLGNGFDIANNFKTGYNDFVESEEFKSLLYKNNALAEHIYNIKTLYNWVDVEIEIGNYSYILEELTTPNNKKKEIEKFFKEFTDLKRALYKYINSMQSSITNPKMEKLIDEWLNLTVPSYNTKLFVISFNYNLWDQIRFNNHAFRENLITGNPLHIHGVTNYLISDSDNIVLGVDYNNNKGQSHNFIVKAFDNQTRDKEYFSHIHNAAKYIIFGCSIGSTDTRYFKPIFEKSKGKEFEIYGYEKIGLADVQNNIAKMCDFDSFKTNNDVKFIDSSVFSQ